MRQSDRVQARLRQIGLIAIIALAVVFIYVVFQATQFDALTDVDALDIAQVARNLSEGEGFTTNWIRPLTLVVDKSLHRHHELILPPLQPLVEAGFFTVFGASARVAAWTSGVAFLITAALTFLLAYRVFDQNIQVSIVAMALVATDTALLRYSISGLESSLLTMLVTLTFLVLYLHYEKPQHRLWLSAVAGALASLIYLTSYVWAVAWIPIVLIIWFNSDRKQRMRNVAIFVVISLLVCLPWFIRNFNLTSNPFFSFRWTETVMNTYSYSANTLARRYDAAPTGLFPFTIAAPREVYRKVRSGLLGLQGVIANTGGPFVSAFFWVAILLPVAGAGLRRIRYASYALFILIAFILSVLGPDARLIVPLAPLVVVTAVGLFFELVRRRTQELDTRGAARWRGAAIGVLMAVHVVPLLLVMVPAMPTFFTQGERLERATNELDTILKPDEPVITDVPWMIAWYSDRPAVWLPARPVDTRRIEAEVGQIDHMVLTPLVMRDAEDEKTEAWARAWRRALDQDITYEGWRVHQRMANASWIVFRRIPQ